MATNNFTVCLCTVPHTGAHFALDLLRNVEMQNVLHHHWRTQPKALPQRSSKFLITARDPYLTALRYIYNGDSMENVAKSWEVCIGNLYNIDHFIIDIGCREEDRLEHICDAVKFLDISPDQYMTELESFANEWKPLNTTEEAAARGLGVGGAENNKAIYLETGKLPNGHDWDTLTDAFDWYRSLPTNDYV